MMRPPLRPKHGILASARGPLLAQLALALAVVALVAACVLAFASPTASYAEDGAEGEPAVEAGVGTAPSPAVSGSAGKPTAAAEGGEGEEDEEEEGEDLPHASVDDDFENLVNPQQLPDSSFIYDTSIIDLSTADSYYDGQTVQVTGEVVGDCIRDEADPDYCWIVLTTVSSESNASISVHMKREDASKIDVYGKYGQTGTRLQVRGTFYLVCTEHTGQTDLHAEYVSVAEKGSVHADAFVHGEFIPGLVLVLVGLIMLLVYYRMRERRR